MRSIGSSDDNQIDFGIRKELVCALLDLDPGIDILGLVTVTLNNSSQVHVGRRGNQRTVKYSGGHAWQGVILDDGGPTPIDINLPKPTTPTLTLLSVDIMMVMRSLERNRDLKEKAERKAGAIFISFYMQCLVWTALDVMVPLSGNLGWKTWSFCQSPAIYHQVASKEQCYPSFYY